jgi:hypothetical protein
MVMIDLGHEKKSLGVISVTRVTNRRPDTFVMQPLSGELPQVRQTE